MPLADILKQPQRMGEPRSKRAEVAEFALGMLNPALGVAQGANDLLSGGGAAGLGMAAAGMIPGVPSFRLKKQASGWYKGEVAGKKIDLDKNASPNGREWRLEIDGEWVDYFPTKKDAEDFLRESLNPFAD